MTGGSFEEAAPAADPLPEPSAPEEPTETDLAAARVLLRSARPGTSRRRPMSSMKKSTGELGEEPTVRPTTARAIANVIVDVGTKAVEEEDDTFVEVSFDESQFDLRSS